MKKYTINVWQINGNFNSYNFNSPKEPKVTRFMINDQNGLVGWIFNNAFYHKSAVKQVTIHEV